MYCTVLKHTDIYFELNKSPERTDLWLHVLRFAVLIAHSLTNHKIENAESIIKRGSTSILDLVLSCHIINLVRPSQSFLDRFWSEVSRPKTARCKQRLNCKRHKLENSKWEMIRNKKNLSYQKRCSSAITTPSIVGLRSWEILPLHWLQCLAQEQALGSSQ